MFHLDNNSGVSAMPPLGAVQSSAPRWFTEGGGGVPASYPGAAWFNMIQAELLNLCAAYGISPDKANLNQLKLAIEAAVNQRAPLASPAFSGVPTAPTASQSTNNTQIATTAFVKAALAALVDSSPAALDTLNELAAALGNDPNFATTMTNALANKQDKDATLTALSGKDVAGLLQYLGLGSLPDTFGSAASANVGTGADELPKTSQADDRYKLKVWISAGQTLVKNTPTIVNHGLTINPDLCILDIRLKCLVANNGYSVGDYAVGFGPRYPSTTTGQAPGSLGAILTSTYAQFNTGPQGVLVTTKNNGGNAEIDFAQWAFEFRVIYQ